jgi:hypothetical protein
MVYTGGLNVYYDVVVPLEEAAFPRRRGRTPDVLKREVGRYEPPEQQRLAARNSAV